MTALAGAALVWGAVVLAVVGAAGWAVVARRETSGRWAAVGRRAVLLAWAWAAAALLLMEIALLRRDSSLAYVRQVTDPDLPLYYTVTSLWAALEGSLLLWLLCLASVAAVAQRRLRTVGAATHAAAVAVLAAVVAAFAVVAAVASPFEAAAGASPAAGPNPLLQDHPAMGVHPPLLYSGFAALAVPFALSCAALASGRVDRSWLRAVRGWALVGWLLLTAGIAIGAWWSYAVLGWGGYWAWDPVENASLLPWLVTTALLHSLRTPGREREGHSWAPALAGSAFLLVLLATFLTRSGVVESVHAFSTSPLGPLLLTVLLGAAAPWLALLVRFHRAREPLERELPVLSRGTAMRANAVLLLLITGTVLLGTILPAALLATTGERMSVGAPWYARTVGPFALVLLVLMALGPWVAPHRDDPRRLLARVRWPAIAAGAGTGVVGLVVPDPWLAVVAGLAAFVLAGLLASAAARPRDRRRLGVLLAHAGVALGAVAVLAGGHGAATQATVGLGESVTAGTTTATLVGLDRRDEGRRFVAEARVLVADEDGRTTWLSPQLRWYPRQQAMLAGPQIRTEPLRDVYLTLLDVDPATTTATLRLSVTPLVPWLWAAAAMTIAGGAVAGWPRRHPAVPGDRRVRPPVPAPPAAPVPASDPAAVP